MVFMLGLKNKEFRAILHQPLFLKTRILFLPLVPQEAAELFLRLYVRLHTLLTTDPQLKRLLAPLVYTLKAGCYTTSRLRDRALSVILKTRKLLVGKKKTCILVELMLWGLSLLLEMIEEVATAFSFEAKKKVF